jgi:starch-binding outer membrane protein, SusD/RagB family
MTSFKISSHAARALARRLTAIGSFAAFAAVAAPIISCSPTEPLEVETPDIINPADVQSPAGADAVRTGALARFNVATSGSEGLFLLGGLFADEWINGDSFIARQEIDQRVITPQNNFLTDANRALHRARLSAAQAVGLMKQYHPTTPG